MAKRVLFAVIGILIIVGAVIALFWMMPKDFVGDNWVKKVVFAFIAAPGVYLLMRSFRE